MQKYNINSILIIIGFALLLVGFFMDQTNALDLQLHDTYLVILKAQVFRVLGILTILNGLVYSLFEKLSLYFNQRFKYFGIVLFFISIVIVLSIIVFAGQTTELRGGSYISLRENEIAMLMLVAGFATLILSLFMPLLIWVNVSIRNILSK